jgi:hypothetical protein
MLGGAIRAMIATMFAVGLASLGCGGRVVVDTGRGGGGAVGSVSSAGGQGTGGDLASCDGFGYVAEGAPCKGDGAACRMTGACEGVRLVCVDARWTATKPHAPTGACGACGAHLFCEAAALCIEDDVAEETAYTRCAPDPSPAGSGQLSCACAASLCPSDEPSCQTVDGAAGRAIFCSHPS